MGAAAVAVFIGAWVQSGSWTYLLSAAGFSCWAFVWSQMSLSFFIFLSEQSMQQLHRWSTYRPVAYAGSVLVVLSLAFRWFL